jgi:hypothetical protein
MNSAGWGVSQGWAPHGVHCAVWCAAHEAHSAQCSAVPPEGESNLNISPSCAWCGSPPPRPRQSAHTEDGTLQLEKKRKQVLRFLVWCSMVQYGAVWCSMVQYGAVWCRTVHSSEEPGCAHCAHCTLCTLCTAQCAVHSSDTARKTTHKASLQMPLHCMEKYKL